MLRGNIIRTAACCVVYNSCAQRYAHKCVLFLNLSVVSFTLVFVCHSVCLACMCFCGRLDAVVFKFCVSVCRCSLYIVCFCDSLDAVVVVFKFALVGFSSSVPSLN